MAELRLPFVTVDLAHRTIRVNKAWKRNGEDNTTDTPGWLAKQLRPQHTMRGHHLGNPKTPKSRRTVTISPAVAQLLSRRIEGKAADDFVFTTRTGLPLHNGDFYTHVWRKLMKALASAGLELIDPVDQTFDPALHEAVSTQPALSPEDDHVVSQVFQQGYRYNGQLLRPARVVVKQWNG